MEPDGSLLCRKISTLFSNRSQTNPVHTFTSCSLSFILTSFLVQYMKVFQAVSCRFPHQNRLCVFAHRHKLEVGNYRSVLIVRAVVLLYLRLDYGCYSARIEEQNKSKYSCLYMRTFYKRLDCRSSSSLFYVS
jgi:hypothetical protein